MSSPARLGLTSGIHRNPVIRLDGKDYFILGGTYQKLHNEKIRTDRYTKDGEIDRQEVVTNKNRWKFTIVVPASTSYMHYAEGFDGSGYDFGVVADLRASAAKVWPYNGLYYYDITANEDFSSTYTSYVHMSTDWESLYNNDPFVYQIPVELWGRDV